MRARELIRIEFPFIFSFVLQKCGVIFPIMWILFFIDRMHAASILAVAMCVIHLRFTIFEETSSKLRNSVRSTNINIEGVEFMGDAGT